MGRRNSQLEATLEEVLECVNRCCPTCGQPMWRVGGNHRTVRTLSRVVRLVVKVRQCENQQCDHYHKLYRPESEGAWVLPKHEFGLDIIALIGSLRYQEDQSVPQIHKQLKLRGVIIGERSVSNLLLRYDKLRDVSKISNHRIQKIVSAQQRVILAIDRMQPDIGHEVLWVIRDCISGEVLLARTIKSSRQQELEALLSVVKAGVGVPIAGVVSDGQPLIRNAVAAAMPDIANGLRHFYYLRSDVKPIYELAL